MDEMFQQGKIAYDAKNYDEALVIWRPLAENGHTEAQYFLGVVYEEGLGVQQDCILACKWFSIAVANGGKGGDRKRYLMAEKMELIELSEARRLTREWFEK